MGYQEKKRLVKNNVCDSRQDGLCMQNEHSKLTVLPDRPPLKVGRVDLRPCWKSFDTKAILSEQLTKVQEHGQNP